MAVCADEVRGGSFRCAGSIPMKKGETEDWHFINLPVGSTQTATTLMDYCRKRSGRGSCVVEQIRLQLGVLKNRKASRESRQLALVWLTHLVGDLHEPLHCATEYSRTDRHDRGGGGKQVAFTDEKKARGMSLHQLWDGVLRVTPEERGPGVKVLVKKLDEDMETKDMTSWLEGDVVAEAALESFKIADGTIYPQYRMDGGKITRSYRDRMRPIAYERIERAGARLAFLIEEAFP